MSLESVHEGTTEWLAVQLANYLVDARTIHLPEQQLVQYRYGRFFCELREHHRQHGTYQIANASPCMQRTWADTRIGMTALFDVADVMEFRLIGYVSDKDPWKLMFPFLTGTSQRSDKLVYEPGYRQRKAR